MKERVEMMISEGAIAKRLEEIADEVYADFNGEQVALVCALKGGVAVLVELAKRLRQPATLNFIRVSSYGDKLESSGKVKLLMDLDEDIAGKNVLVVEDIIDTGRTLAYLRELLLARSPKKLKICTLLDKPERRVVEVPVDYTGFTIPDAFVVGCGLDYAQKYRNLPYVGVIHFEE